MNAAAFGAALANAPTRLPTASELAAIPRYVANRRAASPGAIWPHKVNDLDPVALATAQAKFSSAVPQSKGVVLTAEEVIAVAMARAVLLTAIRHGGMLPWVPFSESSVREARRVGGPNAIPSADKGTIVLDPFGFVPSQLGERDKKTIARTRESLRLLLNAERTVRDEYSADFIGDAAIAPFRAQLAARAASLGAVAIVTGGIVVLGITGVLAWRSTEFYRIEKENALKQYAADLALTALHARLAAGADPNIPSPLEDAAANAIPQESWKKYLGPGIALGVAAVCTVGAIKLSDYLPKKAAATS